MLVILLVGVECAFVPLNDVALDRVDIDPVRVEIIEDAVLLKYVLCLWSGLPSSGKLAEYWFLTRYFDSQGDHNLVHFIRNLVESLGAMWLSKTIPISLLFGYQQY